MDNYMNGFHLNRKVENFQQDISLDNDINELVY